MARYLDINTLNQDAVFDDDSDYGALRAQLKSANVVMLPFKVNSDFSQTEGEVGISIVSTRLENPTGAGTVATATVTAGAGDARIFMRIKGNKFGLLLDKATTNGNPISCLIDGVAYEIDTTWNQNQRLGAGNGGISNNAYQYTMIAEDLGNGDHFVEISFPKFASGSNRSYRLYGYVVDANAGYAPVERGCVWAIPETIPAITSGTWPTSVAGAAADKGASGGTQYYGTLGYNIINDTAGAISFRVMSGSATAANTVLLKTLAAGESYEWRFPKTMYNIDSSIYWVASASGLYTAAIQAI